MREALEDFLFSKNYFAGSGESEHAPAALAALAKLFNIRIASNPGCASVAMVKVAERNLGVNVPKPFYRGFPESVTKLSMEEVVVDRLLHYLRTYGLGDFSDAGHSLFEEEVVRKCFDEQVEVRDYSIIDEAEAVELLSGIADSLLASSRPLSDVQYGVVRAMVEDYGYDVARCNNKDTAARLLLDTRNLLYTKLFKLSDVIRLVEWLQLLDYDGKDVKKLNLKNRDRAFMIAVLDRIFQEGDADVRTCLEKRKLWKGLLHHLHYRPKNDAAEQFLHAIRGSEARSAYSEFERAVQEGRTRDAVDALREEKGTSAVLRHLDYLIATSPTPEDADYVIDQIATDNKILLIQLLYHYVGGVSRAPRVFKFQRLGLMRVHGEAADKLVKPHSFLPEDAATRVGQRVLSELKRACKGALGRVYADTDMKRIALPLQEGISMGGVSTLPRGSRLPIPEGKKIRAFTYWERVDDIDLSAFGIGEGGEQIEFSWRSGIIDDASLNDEAIVYSGDQTSGYQGGSEYFDIDFEKFKAAYPSTRYLVFCDNVYTGTPFAACTCRAGFMMRDVEDSGEVFEPATVKSSFAITCASTFAYLFAIDLASREVVWLNTARDSSERVAGATSMAFLEDYLKATSVINLHDFAHMLATEVVDDPAEADTVFSDKDELLREGAERIRSIDVERVVELLN